MRIIKIVFFVSVVIFLVAFSNLGLTVLIPNDPLFDPWDENNPGGNNYGQEIVKLPSAWDIAVGSLNFPIGIVDGGFDIDHSDLRPNLNIEISDKFDVLKSENVNYDGHGTHVAGISAAKGNNNLGVAGVMWDASLGVYNYTFPTGFKKERDTTLLSVGVMLNSAVDKGAKVINLSAGLCLYTDPNCPIQNRGREKDLQLFDNLFRHTVNRAKLEAKDVLFVISAGNNTDNIQSDSPARIWSEFDDIITVAAINKGESLSVYSNWGNITVAAPGDDIYSTFPDNNYATKSGTSMAAPFVTGLAGLIWSKAEELGKTLTAAEVKDLIIQGAIKGNKFVSGPDGKQIPIINAYESLKLLVAPPTPQLGTDIFLYYGNGGIDFSFVKLKEFYESKGFNTTFTDVFPNDLSTFKLIILLESGALDDTGINFFTPQQISAFENFLLNGNRLVILGEVGAYCLNTVNKLLQDLNIDIQKNDSNAIPGRESSPMTDITDDQITNGVDGILFSAAADLEVDGDAKSLVRENTSGVHLIAVDHFNGAPSRPGGDVVVSGNGSFFDNSTRGISVPPHQVLAENLYNFGK